VRKITYDWKTYCHSDNFSLCGRSKRKLLKDIELAMAGIDYLAFVRHRRRWGVYDVHVAVKTLNDYQVVKLVLIRLTPLWKQVRKWDKEKT